VPYPDHAEFPTPIDVAVSRWWDDPWSRGAWSLLRPGASPATRSALGEPVGARLVIAGEATHPDQAGMTHGAFDEGRRAARWAVHHGHRRVIVVGAGFAGLGAARDLADQGVAVTVLEARERIGGRAHTTTLADGTPVELGANWLQQGDRNTLAPIAAALGLRTVDTDFGAPLDLDVDRGVAPIRRADAILDELERRLGTTRDDERLGDVVDAWLSDADPFTARDIVRVVDAEVTMDAGVPLDELSARWGFETGVGLGDRWIVGGYRQIAEQLATGIDLRRSTSVDRIVIAEHGVTVHAGDAEVDTFAGDAAIVTVPAAVLAAGAITFDPPLPDRHRAALAGITTGRVEKVVARFERRWWPVSTSGYLRVTGPPGCVSEWLDVTDELGAPTIVGIVAGPWLDPAWSGDDDTAARWALGILATATRGP
jgi:monoamine oxidase